MLAFESIMIKNLELKNRIVMPPMCMYSYNDNGQALDFHRVHYGTRAIGGAALIIQEATAVTRQGRISENDLGIWEDNQIDGLASIVQQIHNGGAYAGIQLAHAGRKCKATNEQSVAPSSFHFSDQYPVPHALRPDEINETILAFQNAARRAAVAGYDMLEIHGAHGYLIHEFLSPLSNRRNDEYGGSFDNRLRFLQEVIEAIRAVWPSDRVLAIRLSATDYQEGGLDIQETIRIVNQIKSEINLFHLSSGGLDISALQASPGFKLFPGYQVGFSEAVRSACFEMSL